MGKRIKAKKKKLETWYFLVKHPSGRRTVKKMKLRVGTEKTARKAFYHSTFHFNTEATLQRASKKKSVLT